MSAVKCFESSFSPTAKAGYLCGKIGALFLALLIFGVVMEVAPSGVAAQAFAASDNDNGGGNGGGKPQKGDLYGDTVYLLRDADGLPILINGCIRPLGADARIIALNVDEGSVPDNVLEDDYDAVCADPELTATTRSRGLVDPLAEAEADDELEPCDPIEQCIDNVQEVELGRLSMLKSPEDVMDRQLEEVIKSFDSGGQITFDASGRPVVGGSAFDSPLTNLAMYREFKLFGAINEYDDGEFVRTVFDPQDYHVPPYDAEPFMMAAAFGLGAGDDKEGAGVDSEVVIRVNAILGIADNTVVLDSLDFHYQGRTLLYVDYGEFEYVRESTFPGNICYDVYTGTKYIRTSMSIVEAVFGYDPQSQDILPWAVYDNLGGFAQAADDARKVLVFVHDHNVIWVDPVFTVSPITEANCPPLEP